MELDGKELRREPASNQWRWVWGEWRSHAYDELERRPWTPIVVDGQLCFSVRERGKWFVVVGERRGKSYDDAYDTTAYEGEPLYIAREGSDWLLVLGEKESQRFPFQITYEISGGRIHIHPFDPLGAAKKMREQEGFDPVWNVVR